MTRRKLLVLIPVLALVLNGLGYLVFIRSRPPTNTASSDPALGKVPLAADSGKTDDPLAKDRPASPPSRVDSEQQKEQTALARRAAGMAALEAGDYDKALINFTEARSLIGDRAKVGDLLRVTEDLRAGGTRSRVAGGGTTARSSSPSRKGKSVVERRVAIRDEEAPSAESAPPPVASGLLIVTTTPRGLLVQVDEVAVDLTPMRTKVRAGVHRVVLLDGDRKVYETTVDVKEGGTSTLLKDLGGEIAAEAPRPAATSSPAAPAAAVIARDDAPAPPTPTTMLPPPLPTRNPVTPASVAEGSSGALEISSPGLYGVVWINGRPRGYPPLVVRGLPLGPTKVEVRVNGIQKRSSTVVVKPGATLSVMLRSSDTVP